MSTAKTRTITRRQAIRRAVAARVRRAASIAEALDLAVGKCDRRAHRRAERGARKAAAEVLRTIPALRPSHLSLEERLRARLTERYREEIQRRGGEVTIEEESRTCPVEIVDREPRTGLVLMRAEGWRHYSRRYGARPATLAYLAGTDDSGPWAVRVPGTLERVAQAIAWVEPAAVQRARAEGRRVLRQGDVYAVQAPRDRAAHDAARLPGAHRWESETRTLHHAPEDGRAHRVMCVPFPARLYPQRVYRMGRGGRRGCGD